MQSVRKAEGVSETIWIMQDMLQDAFAPGTDSRSDKIELVEVLTW